MEALDQLLMACHSQSIKPFVESFLHMVAKLLESREPDLQVLGTNSTLTEDSGCRDSHLDNHHLWDPNEFAVSCFRIIMYSIQAQHSHHVIQQVLNHLDTNNKNTPRVRAGIVQVLLETVAIAAKGSVGFFGGNLPDYQRAEVMMFIMGKVPVYGTPCHTLDTVKIGHQGTKRIQTMLLSSLIMVTSGFKSKSMAAALPPPFLDPLFSISLMEDSELRQLVLEILHNIIDRHDNRAKLRGIRIIPNVAALKIKREKISKQDVAFMKKHGQQLYRHIYLGCKEEDNVHKNFELLFTTLAILTIELANEEVVIDLIRLAVALQDMALANEENMPMFIRCGIMALVAAYLNFLSQMIANPPFCQHVSKVIELRNLDTPYLLPEHIFRDKCLLPESLDKEDRPLYFQTADMAECLAGPGYNAERLSIPYVPQVTDEDRLTRRKSFVDTISLQVDILSNSLPDKSQLAEEITFETLKKAIAGWFSDTTGLEEQEREKRRQVMEKFQKAPFEEIAAHCESKANMLHDRLAQIFELTIRPPPSPSGVVSISAGHTQHQSVPVYEMKFPDLCVY
ncbi:hypothetical protein PAMP_005337 [Pampus punctatissimus]